MGKLAGACFAVRFPEGLPHGRHTIPLLKTPDIVVKSGRKYRIDEKWKGKYREPSSVRTV
jgi:hypothetical protein